MAAMFTWTFRIIYPAKYKAAERQAFQNLTSFDRDQLEEAQTQLLYKRRIGAVLGGAGGLVWAIRARKLGMVQAAYNASVSIGGALAPSPWHISRFFLRKCTLGVWLGFLFLNQYGLYFYGKILKRDRQSKARIDSAVHMRTALLLRHEASLAQSLAVAEERKSRVQALVGKMSKPQETNVAKGTIRTTPSPDTEETASGDGTEGAAMPETNSSKPEEEGECDGPS